MDPLLNNQINAQSSPAAIAALQKFLISQGMSIPAIQNGTAQPGVFAGQTQAALAKWQASKGITGAGVGTDWGPRSLAAATGSSTSSSTNGSNSGRTPVQMSDGSTRYYDNTGSSFDANGNPLAPLAPYISPTDTKSNNTSTDTTHATPGGLGVQTDAALNGIDTSGVTPQLNPGTPEYQAAMDAIDTSYYDVLQKQATAQTAQEHQAANNDWTQLKNYIEKNLNITLKDDSVKAWDQLQSFKNQYGNLNLEGSGLQNEAMDKYLNSVRANDEAQRLTSNTKEEEQQANYYQNFATDDQIAAFAAANPDKAQAYGLIPADGLQTVTQRTAAMKAQFPTMSDETIKNSIASMYDKNGYVLSGLNKKFMTGTTSGIQTGTADPTQVTYDASGKIITGYGNLKPQDTGMLDIAATKAQDQRMNVEADSAGKAAAAVAAANIASPQSKLAGNTDPSNAGQIVRPPVSTTRSTAGLPATGSPSATPSNPIPTNTPAPKDRYTMTLLPNGNVKRYNATTGETTQGTAEYMKQFGW